MWGKRRSNRYFPACVCVCVRVCVCILVVLTPSPSPFCVLGLSLPPQPPTPPHRCLVSQQKTRNVTHTRLSRSWPRHSTLILHTHTLCSSTYVYMYTHIYQYMPYSCDAGTSTHPCHRCHFTAHYYIKNCVISLSLDFSTCVYVPGYTSHMCV